LIRIMKMWESGTIVDRHRRTAIASRPVEAAGKRLDGHYVSCYLP
jgi:hypothetical protein